VTEKAKQEQQLWAVVIGASAGGVKCLRVLLQTIPPELAAAIIIVLHLHPLSNAEETAENLQRICPLPVKEAREKEKIVPGVVYIAPANYHLLIERDYHFALTIDPKVNFSRPSIDVLFESAAEAFQTRLIGVVLSGASDDGSTGLRRIKEFGGLALAQQPDSAEYPLMPKAAIDHCQVDAVLLPEEISAWLMDHVPQPEGETI
jgi:two-component system chemotaxis response regulator CheB